MVADLAQQLGIMPIAARLLLQRGVGDAGEAQLFLRPWSDKLHDAMLMKGMKVAVERVARAVDAKELICVYGDYDVDGTTSVAMVYEVLAKLGAHVYFYIPDRHKEGYGLSKQGVRQAIERKVGVLLCVDCGTKAVERVAEAQAGGVDVVVCDHHEPGAVLPPAVAMLNPKQADCLYPFKKLSACGIAFKFLEALVFYQGLDKAIVQKCLDLVVLSIAADIVPITGENRLLAFHGLQRLNTAPRTGLVALMRLAVKRRPVSIADIVFGIAPCINAAGRLSHAEAAVWLLLAEDEQKAQTWAKGLYDQNALRKQLDKQTTNEALSMIGGEDGHEKRYTNVVYKEDWHKGVLGIVASRCVEHYYKPTILLTKDGHHATGSARSVIGYSLYKALQACAPLLSRYGGHAYAAGLTLPCERVASFKEQFEQVVASTIDEGLQWPSQPIDLRLKFTDLNNDLYHIIQQLAPFGPGNRRPVFSTYPVIATRYWVYQDRHLKMHVQQHESKQVWEVIGFGMAPCLCYIKNKQPFAIAYTLQEATGQHDKGLQLVLKDIQSVL